MKKLGQLARPYRVEEGKHFRLGDFDPADTGTISSKRAAAELQRGVDELSHNALSKLMKKLHSRCQDVMAQLCVSMARLLI